MLTVTEDTWIISDTHFGHDNIIRFENRPVDHDFQIWNNWCDMVRIDEPILHLGDVTAWRGTKRHVWEMAAYNLPGDKYLILGNHDREKPKYYYQFLGFTVLNPFVADVGGVSILFTHIPETEKGDWDLNIHGHLHSNGHREGGQEDWHRNVSIELTDYKPIRLKEVIHG